MIFDIQLVLQKVNIHYNIYTVIQVCLDITTILQSISKTEQKTWPPRGGKTNKTRSFATKLQGRSKTEKSE